MKKKIDYSSMTARERKELRRKEQGARPPEAKPQAEQASEQPVAQDFAAAESAMLTSQKRSKRSAIVVGSVVAVSVVLILVALITPIIMFIVNPYRGMGKVVARFDLSNGMVLEYVIEEDKYDTAATNFIFLAKNGYFDNTVFYDAQGGWLRFGGYEQQPTDASTTSSDYSRTKHHAQNESYCKSFAAIPGDRFTRVTYKFGYRLRSDSGGTEANVLNQLGVLTYRYDSTATEFQFNYDPDFNGTIANSIAEIKSTRVGYALDDKTINNLKTIASNAAFNPNLGSGAEYPWKPPTPDIKIKTVKVFNLNGKKWDKFDFLEYVQGNNSNSQRRLSSWVGLN